MKCLFLVLALSLLGCCMLAHCIKIIRISAAVVLFLVSSPLTPLVLSHSSGDEGTSGHLFLFTNDFFHTPAPVYQE